MYYVHGIALNTIKSKYISNLSLILIHYLLPYELINLKYFFIDVGMYLCILLFKYIFRKT